MPQERDHGGSSMTMKTNPTPDSDFTESVSRRYSLLWCGSVRLSEVTFAYDDDWTVSYSKSQRQSIEDNWDALVAAGRRYKNLPLYRLTGIHLSPERMQVNLGRTSYKEYQGTNVAKPDWVFEHNQTLMADPIAVSGVMVTSDGFVMMHLRTSRTGEYPDIWHVTPAGHLHPPQSIRDGFLAELHEELDVSAGEISGELTLVGIAFNKELHKPELLIRGEVMPTSEDLLSRKATDAWEYQRLEPLAWSESTIKEWLLTHVENSVPPGHAALLAAARSAFEDEWFAEQSQELSDEVYLPARHQDL